MTIRKLVILAALVIATGSARADVGVGLFVGEPIGLDVKLGLEARSALDLLFGWDTYQDGRGAYGHLTYLVTPVVASGSSVVVPVRLGIGVAVFDQGSRFADDINVAARFPLEIALQFRASRLELYGEIAAKLTFVDTNDNYPFADLDGGMGLRFYF